MNLSLSFDDVIIQPKFSYVESRKDVDTSTTLVGTKLNIPIISSNMDTVTESRMAKAMAENGAIGALHRFCNIEDNIKMFIDSYPYNPIGSVGLGKKELERAEALYSVGCHVLIVDVAHGASIGVVNQVKELRKLLHHSARIIVGNFANAQSIKDFNYQLGNNVDAYKVGIGTGAACTTRVVTGCGAGSFSTILDCVSLGYDIIADGGIRNSGDFAKAIAAGAKSVMLGRLFAGTDESPGEVYAHSQNELAHKNSRGYYVDAAGIYTNKLFKRYRGSASIESYKVQEKIAEHRTAEGESFLVPYIGSVQNVLQQLSSGLRSSMSYVGAFNLKQFKENSSFEQITNNGLKENPAHGKNND